MGACLWAGDRVVASHRTAAVLWGIDGILAPVVEISMPTGKKPPCRGIVVHRTTVMPQGDVSRKGAIPLTNIDRTLIDLAGLLDSPSLGQALDCVLRKRLTAVPRLEERLAWSTERTRVGSGVLRDLLRERRVDRPPESPLESLYACLFRHFKKAGLPLPRRQYVISDGSGFAARVDFAFPEAKLAVEIDGYSAHMSKRSFVDDRRRDRELQRLGWIVLRFTYDDLESPDSVVAQIGDVLRPRLC
ncbi:MAG: endonuclease domain-containing protein [Actinomycetota bacterium]